MILAILVIAVLVGLVIWGIPRLPQPWSWIAVAVVVIVSVVLLFEMLSGGGHHMSIPAWR